MSIDASSLRWDPYILATEQNFSLFWDSHFNNTVRDVLFIVGRGFDNRASLGSERICSIRGVGRRDALLVNFDNDPPNPSKCTDLTNSNVERYKKVFGESQLKELAILPMKGEHRASISRSTSNILNKNTELFLSYDDIIIDISAMPRMVALTIMVKILHLLDDTYENGGKDINLHILTAESIKADIGATPSSLAEGISNVVGFSGELPSEVNEFMPRIWFPVLGENQEEKLTRIREELRPDEIRPIIPFPSKIARRGDEIINAYRQTLFDDFQIDPRNILYASEFNPYETYRQLFLAMRRYQASLEEIGGCKAFVSPLSSKLLSVGAVLACYEHRAINNEMLKVGIKYVETASYGEPTQSTIDDVELYSMWIRGEWER